MRKKQRRSPLGWGDAQSLPHRSPPANKASSCAAFLYHASGDAWAQAPAWCRSLSAQRQAARREAGQPAAQAAPVAANHSTGNALPPGGAERRRRDSAAHRSGCGEWQRCAADHREHAAQDRSGRDRQPGATQTCGAVPAPAMMGHRERAPAVAGTGGRLQALPPADRRRAGGKNRDRVPRLRQSAAPPAQAREKSHAIANHTTRKCHHRRALRHTRDRLDQTSYCGPVLSRNVVQHCVLTP
jgi:hypothetical protein